MLSPTFRLQNLRRHLTSRKITRQLQHSFTSSQQRQVRSIHNIVFLGAPGAGKGTYAKRVCPELDIPHISTGDLIRDEIASGSKLGLQIKADTEAGSLLTDEIVLGILKKRLEQPDTKKGVLLDGFPRTVSQAKLLSEFLEVNLVLNVNLAEKYLIEKIMGRRICSKCGKNYNVADIRDDDEGVLMPPLNAPESCVQHLTTRKDDTLEVIENRLKIYHDTADPLMDYYDKQGKLRHFNVKKGLDDLPHVMQLIKDELK
eukprot:g468.t1